jgi:hypothetical protein
MEDHAMTIMRSLARKCSVAALAVITTVLPMAACAGPSASNSLFSISVPSSLTVGTDNEGTLIASGPHGEEGLPFLFVYFCTLEPTKKGVTSCGSTWHALTAGDVRELTSPDWNGAIATHDRENGVTEWAACAKQSAKVVACFRRLRSKAGYIDLRYISNASQQKAEISMEAFVASIEWK